MTEFNYNPSPDKRDALWVSINRNHRLWNELDALNYLKTRAPEGVMARVMLKIRMTKPDGSGEVDFRVWSRLERWERRVIQQFIRWHTMQSPLNTVEMYGGTCLYPNDLWDEVKGYIKAGMLRKFTMDTSSPPDKRQQAADMIEYFAGGQFDIGYEALVLTSDDHWHLSYDGYRQLCAFRFWYKHGQKLGLPSIREVVCYLRNYPNDSSIPDVTADHVTQLRETGFTPAYTYATGVKLGLIVE